MSGPLSGLRIVEFAGLGPAPFCGMMLADHGADVIRIVRPGARELFPGFDRNDTFARSRRLIQVDLKAPDGIGVVRDLCRGADGVIEGFRPGVMERLGLGPDVLLADNPALVYGRVTGWGQDGPLAQAAGHDITYRALNGVLHTVGRKDEAPVPPVNYIGDFGGGGMLLAFGMVSALLAVRMGGKGQVIDAAMVDGAALLAGMVWQLKGVGLWDDARGGNWLNGASHFYDSYRCADGEYIALGSLEPQFYALLRAELGLTDDPAFDAQMDPAAWPALKERVAAIIATQSRAHWCDRMEGTDICFAPVLSLDEAPAHPHNRMRGTFIDVAGQTQPAPAPRFSSAPAASPRPSRPVGADADAVLALAGYDEAGIADLKARDIVA